MLYFECLLARFPLAVLESTQQLKASLGLYFGIFDADFIHPKLGTNQIKNDSEYVYDIFRLYLVHQIWIIRQLLFEGTKSGMRSSYADLHRQENDIKYFKKFINKLGSFRQK